MRKAWTAFRPQPARPTVKETETQMELANGSRVVCLPGKDTIRSFQGVSLLVIDKARQP